MWLFRLVPKMSFSVAVIEILEYKEFDQGDG